MSQLLHDIQRRHSQSAFDQREMCSVNFGKVCQRLLTDHGNQPTAANDLSEFGAEFRRFHGGSMGRKGWN